MQGLDGLLQLSKLCPNKVVVTAGQSNVGNGNSGDRNVGNSNSGDGNVGNSNAGDFNSGNQNPGNNNTGLLNTGNDNVGINNTGLPFEHFGSASAEFKAASNYACLQTIPAVAFQCWPRTPMTSSCPHLSYLSDRLTLAVDTLRISCHFSMSRQFITIPQVTCSTLQYPAV